MSNNYDAAQKLVRARETDMALVYAVLALRDELHQTNEHLADLAARQPARQ